MAELRLILSKYHLASLVLFAMHMLPCRANAAMQGEILLFMILFASGDCP